MPTPIEDYRNAAIEHQAAAERAKQIIERVHKGAEMLQQWQSQIVSTVSGAGLPEKFGVPQKATEFDGANWPTGEQIAEALSAYHATRQRVLDGYDAILKPEQFVVQGSQQICDHDPWQFDHEGLRRGAHGMRGAVRPLAQRARQLIPMRHARVVTHALIFEVPARIFSQCLRLLNFSKEIGRDAVARMSGVFRRVATIGAFVFFEVPARIFSQCLRLLNFSKEIGRGAVARTSGVFRRVATIGALVFDVPARIFSHRQRLFLIGNGRAGRSHSSQPSQIARQSVESRVQSVGRLKEGRNQRIAQNGQASVTIERQQAIEALWAAFWIVICAIFFALVILSGFTIG